MRTNSHRLNFKGISLIEVLVASALISIIGLGASNLILNQAKQVKILEAKLDTVDAKGLLLKSLNQPSSPTNCHLGQLNVSDITFNPTPAPSEIPFQIIFEKPSVELMSTVNGYKYSKNLDIESLKIINFMNTGTANQYRGDIEIKPKLKNSSVSFKPILLPSISFTTVTSGSLKRITSCGSLSSNSTVIRCKKIINYAFTGPGSYGFKFTPADCGGVLPNADYRGQLKSLDMRNGYTNFGVTNFNEPFQPNTTGRPDTEGPGFYFYTGSPSTYFNPSECHGVAPCQGTAEVDYYKIN